MKFRMNWLFKLLPTVGLFLANSFFIQGSAFADTNRCASIFKPNSIYPGIEVSNIQQLAQKSKANVVEEKLTSNPSDLSYLEVEGSQGQAYRAAIFHGPAEEGEVSLRSSGVWSPNTATGLRRNLLQRLLIFPLESYGKSGTVQEVDSLLGLENQFRSTFWATQEQASGRPIFISFFSRAKSSLRGLYEKVLNSLGVSSERKNQLLSGVSEEQIPNKIFGMIRINLDPTVITYSHLERSADESRKKVVSDDEVCLPNFFKSVAEKNGRAPDRSLFQEHYRRLRQLKDILGLKLTDDIGRTALLSRLIFDQDLPRGDRKFFYRLVIRTLEEHGVQVLFGEVTKSSLVRYYHKVFRFRPWLSINTKEFGQDQVDLLVTTLAEFKAGVESMPDEF